MNKKYFLLIAIFILFLISFVSAETITNQQISPYTPGTATFDPSICKSGQDFVVQVSPAGCTPAVVRSDLLEEQDIQVYCPLAATQLNPLINVKSISGISFPSGNYSKYVKSIGFYPAQAALGLNSVQTNYPVLTNIGYAVINLKQMQNESLMPDSVTGTLTARLNYNAQNIFGVGNTVFYAPELSDSDWKSQYAQYGFWEGKGFLRASNIQGDSATIQIYDTNLNPTSTLNLKVGQTSNALSISGFDLCSATMQVKLDGVKPADTMAKLSVNGNEMSVVKGQPFLNNQCQVTNILTQGLTQDAQLSCNADKGRQIFDLRISPRVTLNINGKAEDYSLGDFVGTVAGNTWYAKTFADGGKSLYVGYIGTVADINVGNYPLNPNLDNLVVVLVAMPRTALNYNTPLTNAELSSVASFIQSISFQRQPGISPFSNFFNGFLKVLTIPTVIVGKYFISGQDIYSIGYGADFLKSDASQNIKNAIPGGAYIAGLSQGQDQPLISSINQYYQNATSDFQSILNSYSGENYPAVTTSLGEDALYRQMQLADTLSQKNTLYNLCSDFKQRFPQSKKNLDFCTNGVKLSSQAAASYYVSVNGQTYLITLDSVYQPTYEDYGAEVLVRYPGGVTVPYQLHKNTPVFLNYENKNSTSYIDLIDLSLGSASGEGTATIIAPNSRAVLKEGILAGMDVGNVAANDKEDRPNEVVLTLTRVNLREFAQISITPSVSNAGASANFSFNIGIEKRNIQLTPDEIKKKIAETNASIATWEGIANTTGALVNGLSQACTYTGIALFAKSFLSNIGGAGIARQIAMSGAGGWYDKCSDPSFNQGKTVEQCLLQNSDKIENDVNGWNKYINSQNDKVKELQQRFTTKSLLGGDTVNTDAFMSGDSNNAGYLSKVDSALISVPSTYSCPDAPNAAKFLTPDYYKKNFFSVTDARNIELYSNILSNSSDNTISQTMIDAASKGLCNTLKNINLNSKVQEQIDQVTSQTGSKNAYPVSSEKARTIALKGLETFGSINATAKMKYYYANDITDADKLSSDSPVAIVPDTTNVKTYMVVYSNSGAPINTFLVGDGNVLSYIRDQNDKTIILKNPLDVKFSIPSATGNKYIDPKIQYFETQPYQGMPAIVPFDTENGWYAAIEQNVPSPGGTTTATQSYTAAGQVQSFYVCNVGPNRIEEFNSAARDDQCTGINLATNQPYDQIAGLDSTQAQNLVNRASAAIQAALRARATNPSVQIVDVGNNQRIQVGQPAINLPKLKCTDFMSPSDCNILFNVCDPVVCPTSRCNFGGAYPVQDVVQSGIFGSIFLCLPNSIALGGTDVIPVCLPGIQSGLENWASVQKAYRDCLQTNLATGKTTGICDEMNSIYLCQFWWQQAQPLSNLGVQTVASFLAGQTGARGGGEYLFAQNAIQTAQQSANYITNYYAANSAKIFKLQSTQNLGNSLCQNFISLNIPGGAEIANSLSTVDSPPQFTGLFQEVPFTTATVPPTSQYEVYYHIYAGKNSGVYYSVYLQRTSTSSYYKDTSSTRQIDSGYIAADGYQDQKKDFTATSGYNQLCINVNGQVNCDFQQVSTSLAINYLRDQYLAQEANNTQVSSEAECVSGTPNVNAFLNPNVQSGASNYLNPQIYNNGITRICATSNPGKGTDPKADMEGSRWVSVGTCSPNLKCWLDTQSVKSTINSPDIASFLASGQTQNLGNATLQTVADNYMRILQDSGYMKDSDFDKFVYDLSKENTCQFALDAANDINDTLLNKVFYNNQKAYLLLLRARANALLTNPYLCTTITGIENPSNYQQIPQETSPQACSSIGGQACSSTQICQGGAFVRSSDSNNCCLSPGTCVLNSGNPTSTAAPKTTAQTPAQTTTPKTTGGITANDIFNAMNYAKTNQVGNRNCLCGSNCQNYANSLVNAASANGEDPVLLLSIMMQESDCTATAQNGQSTGLMQINADPTNLKQCNSISGISSAADVTGTSSTATDNNIKCGALILKNYYSSYSSGKTYTCGSFSASYSGWDAALRGYIGYGCTGNANVDVTSYVSDVNNRYTALINLINSQKGTTAGASATAGSALTISSNDIAQYNNYKSLFDTYSSKYLPSSSFFSLSQNDFKALLLAIASQNDWGQNTRGGSDWLMGYNSGQTSSQGAERQIATVAVLLKLSLTGDRSAPQAYRSCPSGTNLNADLSCALSVLKTGYTDYSFIFGAIANGDGINYAKGVLDYWNKWKAYLK